MKDIQPAYGECFELSGIELISENLADHDLEHLDMSGTSLMEIPISFLTKLKNLRALRFGFKYFFISGALPVTFILVLKPLVVFDNVEFAILMRMKVTTSSGFVLTSIQPDC